MGGEKEKRSEKFKPQGKPDAEAISMQGCRFFNGFN